MREELRLGNSTPISERLLRSLEDVRDSGNQAILFLNRRGYSSQISCKGCGEVMSCPRCSVSLTYHTSQNGGKLLCHLCGYTEPVPHSCPSCSSESLSFLGFGTQKVEGALNEYIPDMRVLRMDADTTGQKQAYDRMIDGFRQGREDILLGTQMVAKGHDFPRVTLVGVVLADTSLFVSDFRASEKTFSLLTQVIGRAGRASDNGVAVLQTYSPTNEIIRLACTQDYDTFFDQEITLRKLLTFPPFCDIALMTVSHTNEQELFVATKMLGDMYSKLLKEKYTDVPQVTFGPFEAPVYKVDDRFRMRFVIKCRLNNRSRELFSEIMRGFVASFSSSKKPQLAIDFNPTNL